MIVKLEIKILKDFAVIIAAMHVSVLTQRTNTEKLYGC
jgi:hypothetical protein